MLRRATWRRKDLRTGLARNVNPWPDNPMGHSAIDLKYRFQWTYPIVISPHDPKTLYVGSNVLFRTTNDGDRWKRSVPTSRATIRARSAPRADRSRRTRRASSTTERSSRSSESPMQKGVIWTGSDDGVVHVTARQREDVDERDAAGLRWNGPAHVDHRGVAAPGGRRVPGGESFPAERLPAVSVEDDRLRPDLDPHRHRHPALGVHPRHPRGSREARTALRRHRARRLGLVQRRRVAGSRCSSTCRRFRCTTSS